MKLVGLLPFMESNEIKELALKIINGEVKGVKLVVLFPFLRNEDLDDVIDLCIEKGLTKEINRALPFASKDRVNAIYEAVQAGKLEGINENMLFPFLGKEHRKSLFDSLIKKAHEEAVNKESKEEDEEEIYPENLEEE